MKNFAKSILNYFATYTETRFRFATKRLAYQWADDQHDALNVLDFGVFPDFQARILDCVAANKPINISVQKGEYAIRLKGQPVAERLLAYLNDDGSVAALESLLLDYSFNSEDKGKERIGKSPTMLGPKLIADRWITMPAIVSMRTKLNN